MSSEASAVDWQLRVDQEAARLQAMHPGADVRILVKDGGSAATTPRASFGATAERAPTGSTFKPITVFSALRLGLDAASELDCSGSVEAGGLAIRDYTDHGPLTVAGVIVKSSNVGIVRIAQEVGLDALYKQVSTNVALPERAGLREAEAMTTIIGLTAKLSLEELAAAYETALTDPTHGAVMREMLRQAVGPEGTGRAAWVEGVTRGGKTGTAAHDGAHDALFVGIADVEGAPVTVAISVAGLSTSDTGGNVAAPAFARLVSGQDLDPR